MQRVRSVGIAGLTRHSILILRIRALLVANLLEQVRGPWRKADWPSPEGRWRARLALMIWSKSIVLHDVSSCAAVTVVLCHLFRFKRGLMFTCYCFCMLYLSLWLHHRQVLKERSHAVSLITLYNHRFITQKKNVIVDCENNDKTSFHDIFHQFWNLDICGCVASLLRKQSLYCNNGMNTLP